MGFSSRSRAATGRRERPHADAGQPVPPVSLCRRLPLPGRPVQGADQPRRGEGGGQGSFRAALPHTLPAAPAAAAAVGAAAAPRCSPCRATPLGMFCGSGQRRWGPPPVGPGSSRAAASVSRPLPRPGWPRDRGGRGHLLPPHRRPCWVGRGGAARLCPRLPPARRDVWGGGGPGLRRRRPRAHRSRWAGAACSHAGACACASPLQQGLCPPRSKACAGRWWAWRASSPVRSSLEVGAE